MFSRYMCVRQRDQSDCGAAALATVALHHGLPVNVQRMRDLCGTDRVGSNLLGLLEAAEKLGFSAKGVKGPYDGLRQIPLPAVAHTVTTEGLGHFVVLHRITKNAVIVADPGRGVEKLSREEFCKHWTGYLLLLVPQPGQMAPETAGTKAASPWQRFLGLLRPHADVLGEAFLCGLLLTVLALSTSYFVRHLVDSVLVHGEWRLLNALGIGMLALLLFRTLFGVLRQYLLAHVSRKVDLGLVSGYAAHVLRQPLGFFEMRRVGEILSRVNDAVKVRQAVGSTTLTVLTDAVLVVVSMLVMFLYDWQLGLVAALFAPALLVAVGAHHPATKRLSRQSMEQAAGLEAHLVEDVTGVEAIKAAGAERRRAEAGEGKLMRLLESVFSLQKLSVSMNALGMFVTGAAGIVLLWYGGHRVIDGALSIGDLMFFYTLLGFMLDPLGRLASVNLALQDALVALDRLYEIMDLEAENVQQQKGCELAKVSSEIRLENVGFRYGCRSDVLQKLDLRIPAGSTVAIVGESGAGKSTLLKLLLRFYDATEGRITIDGIDLGDFRLSSLRAKIALVSQEPTIFNGTLGENIALGRPQAAMEEIVRAAEAAGLGEFIAGLPQRYETPIGERGVNLSGGQRQRLAIARALLMNPEILLFDEATSHLDTATERAIQRNLRTLLRGKTVLLVAHRLSTVRQADRIVVLGDGRILEEGSHKELIGRGGAYASLWNLQSESAEEPLVDESGDAERRTRELCHAA